MSHLGLLSLIHHVLLLLKPAISYAQGSAQTDISTREYNRQKKCRKKFSLLLCIEYRHKYRYWYYRYRCNNTNLSLSFSCPPSPTSASGRQPAVKWWSTVKVMMWRHMGPFGTPHRWKCAHLKHEWSWLSQWKFFTVSSSCCHRTQALYFLCKEHTEYCFSCH